MLERIYTYLICLGLEPGVAQYWVAPALVGLCILVLSAIVHLAVKRVALRALKYAIAKTQASLEIAVGAIRVLNRLMPLVPAFVIYGLIDLPLAEMTAADRDYCAVLALDILLIFVAITGIRVVGASLNGALSVYQTFDVSREIPGKGFVQVLTMLTYFVGGVLILSILLDRNPMYFFSALGALTAVLLLVFKDMLLGFAAGIQLSANKMVAVGDWIEMPKYGADGEVIDIALTTVKVQNWNKTITTIPAYSLIGDSFKNWRGMQEAGGRQIKRSILIDVQTIAFCDAEMLARFSKIKYIAAYLEQKKQELARFNDERAVDESSLVNGRHLTNIGTFRAYVVAYLKNHPKINRDLMLMVRQLAPGEHGLPIEIYVFCNDTAWADYEAVQADIFDHLLAVVPAFDLGVFQVPTGSDFKELFTVRDKFIATLIDKKQNVNAT